MIPRKIDNTFLSNSEKETAFTIKASAKMFNMLSDKVYTHKPAAVVREICCNAYDSMVASGKGDVPFVVTLPNPLHLYFEVEDFGVGMDEDDVKEIYTVFGESTKTNDNSLIGALGIGCKSPLSYSKTFTIRTRKDGVELHYNVYIGQEGEPMANQISKSLTNEPNGFKVSIPVKESDMHKFRYEMAFIGSFFKVKPTIIGANFAFLYEGIGEELEGGKIVIREYNNQNRSELYTYNNCLYAVMGGVCYSVDPTILPENVRVLFDHMGIQAGKKTAFLKFALGELDFSMSRESLSYDETTQENLRKRFHDVVEELTTEIQNKIDQAETIMGAAKVFFTEFSGIIGSDIDYFSKYKGLFSFKGYDIVDYFNHYLSFPGTGMHINYFIRWGRWACDSSISVAHLLTKKFKVIYSLEKNTRGIVTAAKHFQRYVGRDTSIMYFSNVLTEANLKRIKGVLSECDVEYINLKDWRAENQPEQVVREQKKKEKIDSENLFYGCPIVSTSSIDKTSFNSGIDFCTSIYSMFRDKEQILDLDDGNIFFAQDGASTKYEFNDFKFRCVANHLLKNGLYKDQGSKVTIQIKVVLVNERNKKVFQRNPHLDLNKIIKENTGDVYKKMVGFAQAAKFFVIRDKYYGGQGTVDLNDNTRDLIKLGFDVKELGINKKDYEGFMSGDEVTINRIKSKLNFFDSDEYRQTTNSLVDIRFYNKKLIQFKDKIEAIRRRFPMLEPYVFADRHYRFSSDQKTMEHLKAYIEMVKNNALL